MKYIWHEASDYKNLSPITQAYGVCFDQSGNILIMQPPRLDWNLPGGSPEAGETPEQALVREVDEEVSVNIGNLHMLGYYEVINTKPKPYYHLRFGALIKQFKHETIDPDTGNINQRKMVAPEKFFDYITIEGYRPLINAALDWYKSL